MPSDQTPLRHAQQPYYHEQPTLGFSGLAFDWSNPPFNDINARKAFCLAINRDQFNQQVYQGQMLPTWHLVPEGMAGYNPSLQGLDCAPVTGDATLATRYWQMYLVSPPCQVPTIGLQMTRMGASNAIKVVVTLWNQMFGVQAAGFRATLPWTGQIIDPWSFVQILYFTGDSTYVDPQRFLQLIQPHLSTEQSMCPPPMR